MVINLDQIPSKYVPGCNKTLAPKGIKSVSVAGSTDKRTITATFNITMDSKFSPMQIIYGGKTSKSIPTISFPDSFLVSANKKQYSNERESLKMLEHIIIPYVKKQLQNLSLDPQYPALLIMDMFRGRKHHQPRKSFSESNLSLSTARCSRWSKRSCKKIYEEVYSLVCSPSKEWIG